VVGKGGFEPPRLAALDSKSRLSANSSTSPQLEILAKITASGKIIIFNKSFS
jgi:hypothetical protein